MYQKYFGLNKKPFDLSPDSELIYLSDSHREALAMLRYGIVEDKGFVMLTGGVGTGKTTLLNSLLKSLPDEVRFCLLNNPTLTRQEFYSFLSGTLGLTYDGDKGEFILRFTELLEQSARDRKKILLVIDEAQAFSLRLLEELRLLSNLAGERNVLSIFLVGQPELQEVLASSRLLPLRQRIGISYHLRELDRDDTAQYIAYRLNRTGAANPTLFTDTAVAAIHRASHGNPRLINIICDHALISAFAADARQVDEHMVESSIQDVSLAGETTLSISGDIGDIVVADKPIRRARRQKERDSTLMITGVLVVALGLLYFMGWITW